MAVSLSVPAGVYVAVPLAAGAISIVVSDEVAVVVALGAVTVVVAVGAVTVVEAVGAATVVVNSMSSRSC